jgi:DNA-binding NarL/FixJ family response regulator
VTDSPPEGVRRPRVLIADDDSGIRKALTQLLSLSCEVVGYVVDTGMLLATTQQLRPDVVLLDFSLRGEWTSLEACRELTSTMPDVKVVVFTAHDGDEFRVAAQRAGASGFVWKPRAADELLRTIQSVIDTPLR